MTEQRRRAVGYVRVSTEEQHLGPQAQRERIEAWCKAYDYDLVEVIEDIGVSGGVPLRRRPNGQRLAALIDGKAPGVDALVVAKLDRLTRDAEDGMALVRSMTPKRKQFVALVTIAEHLDLSTPFGRFAAKQFFLLAELEREQIGWRTSEALQSKKRNGLVYGRLPYGWDREGDRLVPNDREQAAVADMRALRDTGLSFAAIARQLNDQGVPTKRNGAGGWQSATVMRTLAYEGAAST